MRLKHKVLTDLQQEQELLREQTWQRGGFFFIHLAFLNEDRRVTSVEARVLIYMVCEVCVIQSAQYLFIHCHCVWQQNALMNYSMKKRQTSTEDMRDSEWSEICEWDYPFLYNNGKVTFTGVRWNPVGIQETFHHSEFTALFKRMLHYSESLHY